MLKFLKTFFRYSVKIRECEIKRERVRDGWRRRPAIALWGEWDSVALRFHTEIPQSFNTHTHIHLRKKRQRGAQKRYELRILEMVFCCKTMQPMGVYFSGWKGWGGAARGQAHSYLEICLILLFSKISLYQKNVGILII